MKRMFPRMLYLLLAVVVGVIISSAIYATTGFSFFGRFNERPASAIENGNAELVSLAYTVLGYIDDGDYLRLSRTAHPEYGVTFSPYATVNPLTNQNFQAEQIAAFGRDTTSYVWGVINGSGEPILMTPANYFAEYVVAGDYLASSVVGVNHIVRSGDALENINEIPGIQFVDFHLPDNGRNSNEESKWSSLRLGFEEYEGRLWLTLILHSRWSN